MAVFKTCFGCWSLRTGCLLIGGIELFVVLLAIALYGLSRYVFIETALLCIFTYGAFEKNCLYLWLWMFVNIAKILSIVAFAFFYIIFVLVKSETRGSRAAFHHLLLIVVAAFLTTLTIALMTLVIYSYIYELREVEKRKNKANVNVSGHATNLVLSESQI